MQPPPPPGYTPQQPAGNGIVKPLLIGCGVVLVVLLVAGGIGAYFTFRAVGSALHTARDAATVAQGAVSSAQQAMASASAANPGGSPDPQQAAAAGVAALQGLVNGGKSHAAMLSREDIKADLPEAVDSLSRTSAESRSGSVYGITGSSASATYGGSGDGSITVEVTDAVNMSGLTAMLGLVTSVEQEDDSGYEKNVQLGDTKVHEKWQNADKHAELIGVAGNRFVIDVTGNGVDMSAAERAFQAVDVAKLESAAAALPKDAATP